MGADVRSPYSRSLKRIFYANLVSPWTRYREAFNQLLIPQTGRILDLGCGYTAPGLTKLGLPRALMVGIDLVDGFETEKAPAVKFSRSDAGHLPFHQGVFDAVVSRAVIEHLEDPRRVFQEVFRVLIPGGCFLFLTPNRYDYVSMMATVVPNRYHGKIVRQFTGRPEKNIFPTHYRANTRRRISQLATAIGFEVVELELIRDHPHYLQSYPLLYLMGMVYEQFVERNWTSVRPWILGVLKKPNR